MFLALGIAGGTLLLLIFVVTELCLRGRRIRRDLAARYPAPGRRVDVGGYRLHIHCQGDTGNPGDPVVVLEAAEFSLSWDLIQSEVARFARVCSYDRAGLGWSDRGPRPRTAANIVEELHSLLGAAGVRPPYVLVGHSKGGMFVRLYAHRYPDEVAGMVLVDAAHEEQELRFPASIARLNRRARNLTVRLLGLIGWLNPTGFLAPFLKRYSDRLLGTIPERVREMGLATVLSDDFFGTVAEETRALEGDFAAVRAAQIRSLGDIPLSVLTSVDQFDALEGQVSKEEVQRLRAVVSELQAELAALSPRGRQVMVRESGHHIQIDQPQAVVDAVRQVVGAARQRTN